MRTNAEVPSSTSVSHRSRSTSERKTMARFRIVNRRISLRSILAFSILFNCVYMSMIPNQARAMWLFQLPLANNTPSGVDQSAEQFQQLVSDQHDRQQLLLDRVTAIQTQQDQAAVTQPTVGSSYSSYASSLMSIAGIQPSGIASMLNTISDTGFRYFNIEDQCRNRAACDLGSMLYKKLSFVHNWLIRTSVRTLTDMNNVYMQSWMEGMLGRNCTTIYVACRQSPLEGLMSLAMIQHLAQ